MTNQKKVLIGVIALLATNTARAADHVGKQDYDELFSLSLTDLAETRITVASKREEALSDAPSIITVVTAKEIEQYGAKNLKDILNRVPSIQGMGSFFYSNIINMRGQLLSHSNNEVLFLVNGRPHRTSYNGGANYSLLLGFPLEMIERLEIIRGPGSVLYGSGAVTGVVNIITKSPEDTGTASVSATVGSFSSRGLQAKTGMQWDNAGVTAGFKNFHTEGWKFTATDELGVTDSVNMAEKNTGVVATANYHNLSLMAVFTQGDQDNLGQGARWPYETQEAEHTLLDATYHQTFSSAWNADYHLTFNDFNFRDNSSRDILLEPTLRGDIGEKFDLIVGGLYEDQSGTINQRVGYETSWASLYTQLDYQIKTNLKMTAGVQINKPKNLDADTSPRLGLVSNFKQNWGIKLLYGEAFRSAYATERYLSSGRIIGDPNLRPEKIATYDAQVFYHTQKYYAALNVYHSRVEDVITRVPIGGGVFKFSNEGEIAYSGVELEGNTNLNRAVTAQGSVTYQTNEDESGDQNIKLSPNWMAKLGIVYQNDTAGYSIGVFNTFFDTPTAVSELNPTVSEVNPEPQSYHLVTANFSFDIPTLLNKPSLPDMDLAFYIDNLLDEQIHYPEFVRQRINSIPIYSGRAVYATFSINF